MSKAIVLLHGWGNRAPEKLKPLGEKLKLLGWKPEILSLPGFGNSPEPPFPFSLTDYSAWVVGEIKARRVQRPVLFGHSLGGQISAFINIHGMLPTISGLVLCESAAIRPSPSLFRQLIKKTSQITPTVLKKYARPWFKQINLNSDYHQASEIMKKTLIKVLAEDLTQELHRINSKTLIIWGENDRTIPLSLGRKTQELISGSTLKVIPSASHSLPYTHFLEISNLINEFYPK